MLGQEVRPPGQGGLTGLDQQVRPIYQAGQTGPGLKNSEMSKSEHPEVNGGKGQVEHNGKKLKLTFDELLAKYQKDNEAKRANQLNDAKSSRLPPKHNYGNWNRQRKSFQSASSYSPFESSMPVSYAPYSTSVHPYSPWEWSHAWVHTPSYFRPHHVEYAVPREPSHAR